MVIMTAKVPKRRILLVVLLLLAAAVVLALCLGGAKHGGEKPQRTDAKGGTNEARMATAHERLQWQMNTCLAQIGIEFPEHRQRALAIGERLGVLRDYPTPPNCTSPFAPAWIAEMVRRREGGA